jgi:GNAT superfamily N-acetyltransferase
MLTFDDLIEGNWNKYGNFVLQSETIYPEFIRSPGEEFIDIVKSRGSIAKIALLDSEYIGNAVGFCMDEEDKGDFGLDKLPGNPKIIYLFNILINPAHQGKGYGSMLTQEFIKSAKAMGYDYIAGHFRPNGSLHMIKKFGAVEGAVCKNWENIGEDYVFCILDLRSIPGTLPGRHVQDGRTQMPPLAVPQLTVSPAMGMPTYHQSHNFDTRHHL